MRPVETSEFATSPVSWQRILQIATLIAYLFGTVACFFVMFYPAASADGFSTGLASIFVVLLLVYSEIHAVPFADYLQFLHTFIGKGSLMWILGGLHASTYGVFLASVIIFWVWGTGYIILGFLGFSPSAPLCNLREQPSPAKSGQPAYDSIPDARAAPYEEPPQTHHVEETPLGFYEAPGVAIVRDDEENA
jgi:hypothetical protein